MINKRLYENQKHTLYEIQKFMGVNKDYLYKYVRGERKIKNMPASNILKIAYFEKVEVNKLYKDMIDYQRRLIYEKDHKQRK